ncbi:NosD domain-containing protein [Cyclobacterium amurskyense]|uniref:NosD domain-containing protein n=1 Tax=Cyclobacterium amurskyense TaxID=320787 RepID=UPI0030D6EFB9|tara:strand:+ start:1387 stop:2778 length:1392 start_codon:yes stop_codon:yes gene_type:complete
MHFNKLKTTLLTILFLSIISWNVDAKRVEKQKLSTLAVSNENIATVEALTNHGKFTYHLDNTGNLEVSAALQAIFDELGALKDVSATITFLPGVYFLDAPVVVKIASVKLIGHAHGGIDIHGANIESGTIFRLGKNTGPNCITFDYAGRSKAFPSGETPWPNQNLKVELENLSFVGYNNTGVNTADGYSRFRNDEPNFRGLHWYPTEDRYKDVEAEGQRAIVLPKAPKGEGVAKCELLRLTGCYFTELYVAIDIADCDVSYINKNWFGQLTYGIRLHGNGQGMMASDNLFADLETAFKLKKPVFSTFHNNTFAYISKCFEIDEIQSSTITGNAVYNWKISTGAAAYGSFCHVKKSMNLNVSGNSIAQYLDSRKRSKTTDSEPNGQSFIQFDNAKQLMFSNNIVHTLISQTVVRLHNSSNSVVVDNIITFGEGGNAVAETGDSKDNLYRPIDPKDSAPFDKYKY